MLVCTLFLKDLLFTSFDNYCNTFLLLQGEETLTMEILITQVVMLNTIQTMDTQVEEGVIQVVEDIVKVEEEEDVIQQGPC